MKISTVFNVTKSILTKKTEIDSVFNLKWREDYFKPFMFVFSLTETTVLAKESSNKRILKENIYTPPRYLTFNLEERRHKREYELYSEFNNKSIEDLNEAIHFSFDKLSPNRNKLAMAMVHLAQINILDLETGKLKGIRMSGTESFASLEEVNKPRDLKMYYKNIDVDEHNIYALFIENNAEAIADYESSRSDVVQVFDWEGNYIRKLKLDQNIEHISVDSKNRLLYGVNNEDGVVYRYRLD